MDRGLILLRHGETTFNATRRMQGQLDTELSELGTEQARQAAERLSHLPITRILSSDLQRAALTADMLAQRVGVAVELDERLRETFLGEWQGMTHTEVDAQFPGKRALWRNSPEWAPPGGESRLDVAARARPVVDELVDAHPTWPSNWTVIVAHGGTISALTSSLLGFGAQQYSILGGLGNCASSVLLGRPDFDGSENLQWYLRGWNVGGKVD